MELFIPIVHAVRHNPAVSRNILTVLHAAPRDANPSRFRRILLRANDLSTVLR